MINKEAIQLLGNSIEGTVYPKDGTSHYKVNPHKFHQALALLKEQPPDSEFTKEIREQLAELCHEQWSDWMKYMFSKCLCRSRIDGIRVIPAWAVKRWARQVNTPYEKLSPEEQDSDRAEADKFISLIQAYLDASEASRKELVEALEENYEFTKYAGATKWVNTEEYLKKFFELGESAQKVAKAAIKANKQGKAGEERQENEQAERKKYIS